MLKKTLLSTLVGAAIITASGSALASSELTDKFEIYGQVAVSVWQFGEDKINTGEQPIQVENESRIGVRGDVDLTRGPNLFWQLEGGNVGDAGQNSGLGVRDTFVGINFEDGGKIRLGRLLTPLYQMIDWPYSGQRAGAVFDWGGDIVGNTNYDRQSNMIRYDSAERSGFKFSLAGGRGTESDAGSNFIGAGAHLTKGNITINAGAEYGVDRQVSANADLYDKWLSQQPGNNPTFNDVEGQTKSDTQAYLLGFEADVTDDFQLYGAIKYQKAVYEDATFTVDGVDVEIKDLELDQGSYSVGVVYSGFEHWVLKANYAANLDVKSSGTTIHGTADSIISAQALYFLSDSALTYVRPYVIDQNDSGYEFGWGAGVEYYF
ncbi:porin [Vibrio ezurae]|uniref:Porin n=1 Tax=Vibrio ezurae NBRC 102218 TaxID=1219080 RepID=U3B4J1_9VIBR|nr:porin [Vibrio ezurae]GAD80850.1 hypothetical protein VEZ01S_44_00530 [Vibrio ezurae NBRC 102218]